MKKLIAILVVLAVAAGTVFAQEGGSWSVGGHVHIGEYIDFAKDTVVEGQDPKKDIELDATGDRRHYDDWDSIRGSLGISYNNGGLGAGINLNTKGDSDVNFSYYGDNYAASASGRLSRLLTGGWWTTESVPIFPGDPDDEDSEDYSIDMAARHEGGWLDNNRAQDGQLWGWYEFLDGKLHLEASVIDRWADYWGVWTFAKDKMFAESYSNVADYLPVTNNITLDIKPVDGVSFGVIVPNFFKNDDGRYLRNTFGSAVIGAKIEAIENLGIEADFVLRDYRKEGGNARSLFIGGKYDIGAVTPGLFFNGRFGIKDEKPDNWILVLSGLSIQYNADRWGAALAGGFETTSSKVATSGEKKPKIMIYPQFKFAIVENYLGFLINGDIWFKDKTFSWTAVPELSFNFLGTDAFGVNTGMFLRYNYGMEIVDGKGPKAPGKDGKERLSPNTNRLDAFFKWSF